MLNAFLIHFWRFHFQVAFTNASETASTARMRARRVARYRENSEVYTMSAGNDKNNTKVRGGLMDIKVLINRAKGVGSGLDMCSKKDRFIVQAT